jgi:hypothetical protein
MMLMTHKRSSKRLSDKFELILTLGTGLAAVWVFAALVFSMM